MIRIRQRYRPYHLIPSALLALLALATNRVAGGPGAPLRLIYCLQWLVGAAVFSISVPLAWIDWEPWIFPKAFAPSFQRLAGGIGKYVLFLCRVWLLSAYESFSIFCLIYGLRPAEVEVEVPTFVLVFSFVGMGVACALHLGLEWGNLSKERMLSADPSPPSRVG
jgi:hypothetical protein